MFCSSCQSVDQIYECRRKICPVGHVLCEQCDENLEDCPKCSNKFSGYVNIHLINEVPRMLITYFKESCKKDSVPPSPQSAENIENLEQHSLNESDSLLEIIEGLKFYDGVQERDQGASNATRRFLSNFELVDTNSTQKSTTSWEITEEEREALKLFKICKKSPLTDQTEMSSIGKIKSEPPAETPFMQGHDRQIQTSVTYVVDKGSGDTKHYNMNRLPSSVKGHNTKHSNSCDCYPNDNYDIESSVESCDNASVYEIYAKNKPDEDSETAHFTSLTVSRNDPSPPDSPARKGIPSLGHRVRFSSFYLVDGRIPAQMEPMNIYELNSSDSSDSSLELPSDRALRLPRFPVRCPITNCESLGVPSDFCNHLTIDHPYVDVMKIAPEKLINMKINHKRNSHMVTCQRLFLVSDKINDIGYGAFENCLPITLLTSTMTLGKTFGFSTNDENLNDKIFYIFLVGVYQFPINYTITVWAHGRDDYEPTFIKCMSNSVFFMSKPFNPKEVAGNSLSISHLELQKLTNEESKTLSCQIVFH